MRDVDDYWDLFAMSLLSTTSLIFQFTIKGQA